jgi:hypothetical protein
MGSRDREIERVARQLDALLDDLGASVAALSGILTRTPPADQQGSDDERLAAP